MINLHAHTTFSDGAFAPEEVVQAAISGGLTHLGISDHYRTSKLAATASYVILEGLREYIDHVRALAASYAPQISVLVGLEVDFSKRTPMEQFWERGFRQTPLNDLDYVLFEYVNDDQLGGLPLTALLAYRRWIQVPVGLAHSFLARDLSHGATPQELARTLAEHEIFVELCPSQRNAARSPDSDTLIPYYRYPGPYNEALWREVRDGDVLLSIGTDSHDRLSQIADVHDAWAYLQERELVDHLVTQRHWPRPT